MSNQPVQLQSWGEFALIVYGSPTKWGLQQQWWWYCGPDTRLKRVGKTSFYLDVSASICLVSVKVLGEDRERGITTVYGVGIRVSFYNTLDVCIAAV